MSTQIAQTRSAGAPAAWDDYVDLLRACGELNALTQSPDSDQLRAELYRQFAMNIALGYFMYFQSDSSHPDWAPFLNSVFMLQPNPDDVYFNAYVDSAGTYRIVGERGSVRLLTMSMGRTAMGTGDRPGPSLAYVDFDDLQLGPEGEIELLLSRERPAGHTGNWIALHPEADYLLLRARSYDWGRERDPRIAIERLDISPIRPRMSKEQIDRRLREVLGGFPRRLSAMWLHHQKSVIARGMINKLELVDFGGAVGSQLYWQGFFDLGPDDALILETELPAKRRYWNVQLNDELFNAVDYIYRQSSLNGHQARVDADGKFRAVISMCDPGVHNWLDPGETRRGILIGRWLGCDSNPVPTLTRVPFAELNRHLPAGTPRISREERNAALRARRIGAQLRRRW
jgi:Protein of unknown function (DUF1214)